MFTFFLVLLLSFFGVSVYAEAFPIVSSHPHTLAFLINPDLAYILLLIAIYGILFEVLNPGLILPGAAGVVALITTLYIFQILPVNYTGLSLLLIGLIFIIAEIFVTTYGIFGIGGTIAFIVGSFLLFNTPGPGNGVTWQLIIFMGILSLLFFVIVARLAVKSQRKKVVTGKEAMIGATGVVLEYYNEENIAVRVMGEIWRAHSKHPLSVGQKIHVTAIKGLTITVEANKN